LLPGPILLRISKRDARRIDLARVYAEIWKDAAPAHLVDIAVFCDNDDTHTATISYFAPATALLNIGISTLQPGETLELRVSLGAAESAGDGGHQRG
jgi:hypothetical protein